MNTSAVNNADYEPKTDMQIGDPVVKKQAYCAGVLSRIPRWECKIFQKSSFVKSQVTWMASR